MVDGIPEQHDGEATIDDILGIDGPLIWTTRPGFCTKPLREAALFTKNMVIA